MRILDLFCGAGGAAMGYAQAGFDVVGIDIAPQPRYPFQFVQDNALTWLGDDLAGFDVIHASPPCQGYSDLRHRTGRDYPKLIETVRDALERSGKPYVIENVEGAPLRDPVMLCGTMFAGLRVLRHRLFESNLPLAAPSHHNRHPRVFTHDKRKAHYGKLDQNTAFVQVTGGGNCSIANARDAMKIGWMNKAELNEAIPPAYTRWVGGQLLEQLRSVA